MVLVAVDTETLQIGPGSVAPPIVCYQWATATRDSFVQHLYDGAYLTGIHPSSDLPAMLAKIKEHLAAPNILVFANAAFDLAVICREWPELYPVIWEAIDEGRIKDVQIRERLINLSTSGDLEFETLPDGDVRPILYSLASLTKRYLSKDRFEEKGKDGLHLEFSDLRGKPLQAYPGRALVYAMEDVKGTFGVYLAQNQRIEASGATVSTEDFQVGCAFALHLATCWGIATDPVQVAKFHAEVASHLTIEKMAVLVEAGILRPDDTVDTKVLKAWVEEACNRRQVPIKRTEKTQEISTDGDTMEQLAPNEPIAAAYAERQQFKKLTSTYIPVLESGRVFPQFQVLVSTGRTSSYGAGPGRKALFPSCNIQNQPRLKGARECFVPDPGFLFLGTDYDAAELVGFAQATFSLLGSSVHRDKINEGKDIHAYTGAHLAAYLDPAFGEEMRKLNPEAEVLYNLFMSKKEFDPKFYKHWRDFAKPVGLGYPGGLGVKTFVEFARSNYGVVVTEDLAERLREIWRGIYPEALAYFEWVNRQEDPDKRGTFKYVSKFGMVRKGCSYTEIANGFALQTPIAEGAKLAYARIVRAMTVGDTPLRDCRPGPFVHDEIIIQAPDDQYLHERAEFKKKIMVDSLSLVCPDVRVGAKPLAMRRWSKDAKPRHDANGRLIPWEPEQQS